MREGFGNQIRIDRTFSLEWIGTDGTSDTDPIGFEFGVIFKVLEGDGSSDRDLESERLRLADFLHEPCMGYMVLKRFSIFDRRIDQNFIDS